MLCPRESGKFPDTHVPRKQGACLCGFLPGCRLLLDSLWVTSPHATSSRARHQNETARQPTIRLELTFISIDGIQI